MHIKRLDFLSSLCVGIYHVLHISVCMYTQNRLIRVLGWGHTASNPASPTVLKLHFCSDGFEIARQIQRHPDCFKPVWTVLKWVNNITCMYMYMKKTRSWWSQTSQRSLDSGYFKLQLHCSSHQQGIYIICLAHHPTYTW